MAVCCLGVGLDAWGGVVGSLLRLINDARGCSFGSVTKESVNVALFSSSRLQCYILQVIYEHVKQVMWICPTSIQIY